MNDQINTILGRYEAFKKGDYSAVAMPIPQAQSSSGSNAGGLSLIDFDDVEPQGLGTMNSISGGNAANDLSDLFASSTQTQPTNTTMGWGNLPQQQPAFGGQVGGMGMGVGTMGFQHQQQTQPFAPTPIFSANGGVNAFAPAAAIRLGTPGSQRGTPIPSHGTGGSIGMQGPNYFGNSPLTGPAPTVAGMGGSAFGATTSPPMGGMGGMGGFNGLQPQQQKPATTSTTTTTTGTQQAKDPFADLAGLF